MVKKNAGADVFSPEVVPSGGAPTGNRPESYRN